MYFVGTGSALCLAAWVLLVMIGIVSCSKGFVGTGIALCRATWVLFVMSVH